MKITRDNYEAFLLDAMENQLSADQQKELQLFLKQNADLDSGIPERHLIFPDPIKSISKDFLDFTKLSHSTRKHFFVASIEGDLDAKQEEELQQFIKNNKQYEKEYKQYAQTIFTPDDSISYNDKDQLHQMTQKSKVIPLFRYYRVAAVIALLLGMGSLLWLTRSNAIQPQYAQKRKIDLKPFELQNIKDKSIPFVGERTQLKPQESSSKPIEVINNVQVKENITNLEEIARDADHAINHQLYAKVNFPRTDEKLIAPLPILEPQSNKNNDVAEIEPIEDAFERIMMGEYLVSSLNNRMGFLNENFRGTGQLANKLTSFFGEESYVEKNDGKQVKTQFSIGKIKIERIHSN